MAKKKTISPNDLLTSKEASEALNHRIQPQTIRIRVRRGDLPCYWQQSKPGIIYVKRGELMKLYEEQINGWADVRRRA